jgi:lysophospholipase L1-like esterase
MRRKPDFRPSVTALESRWLPAVSVYPDAMRNALQASYVGQAKTGGNDLVFLGDSITQYWETASGAAIWDADFASLGAANFGIAGDTTQNVLGRVEGGDLDGNPRVVVLMIGNNDLSHGSSAEQTAQGIASVVQAIHSASPASKVLLLGVLPTDVPFLNANIPEVNTLISALAAEPYVTYLNPGVQFEQADGSAQPGLLKDGVHPDASGYQVLANAIDGTILGLLREGAQAPSPTPAASTNRPPLATTTTTPAPSVADLAFIPLVETSQAPTINPVEPAEGSSHPKSFATELIDVSTS